MTDTIAQYRRALDVFDVVIQAVRPDQWNNPTPCPDWTALDVAGHIIGGQLTLRAFATGAEPLNPWVKPRRLRGRRPGRCVA
jgi:uncharacterized protein (TIGR03083 family)